MIEYFKFIEAMRATSSSTQKVEIIKNASSGYSYTIRIYL